MNREVRKLTNQQYKFRVFYNDAEGTRCMMKWYATSAKKCKLDILELVGEHDHYLNLSVIEEIFAIRGDK